MPTSAPEVELIDQWDVMGMRGTVSHSVRITGYDVPPERLIGEPGDWTRRDPRTFTLAFAANHIGAPARRSSSRPTGSGSAPTSPPPRSPGRRSGRCRAICSRPAPRSMRPPDIWDRGDHDAAELESIRALHLGKRTRWTLTQTGV